MIAEQACGELEEARLLGPRTVGYMLRQLVYQAVVD